MISLSHLTLDLVDVASGAVTASFPVAVGAALTASPIGTGFVEARYSDPQYQPEVGIISLTSLHSTAADAPFGVGGLVAVHRYPRSVGPVSHGCFRVSDSTAAAFIARVPVGALVTVTA
ncbi:L,D-transpeptidase [Lacisediminihabitans sp. FW035]